MLAWITLGGGKARFVGPELGADDEPHMVLAVELGTDGTYFGEFAAVYEPDRTHYNVEIISFGVQQQAQYREPALRGKGRIRLFRGQGNTLSDFSIGLLGEREAVSTETTR